MQAAPSDTKPSHRSSFSQETLHEFGKKLAHDLKAPVDSIRSVAELLKINGFNPKTPSEDQKELFNLLEKASARADQNTRQLIDFFKLPKKEKSSSDLEETISSLLEHLGLTRVNFEKRKTEPPAGFYFDPRLLRESLHILFADFLKPEKITLSKGRHSECKENLSVTIEIQAEDWSEKNLKLFAKDFLELNPLDSNEAKVAQIQKVVLLHQGTLEASRHGIKLEFPLES
jgi:nitrogen fixation/metabolism regulation signal transduction histidine kinase